MPPKSQWTPSRILTIREKAKTMTAAQLAFEFGTSRNAIIGLCHRHGIMLTAFANMLHPDGNAARAARRKPKPVVLRNGIIPNIVSKPVLPYRVKPISPGVWASGGCLAVIGEPREFRGCCVPVRFGSVYCDSHHMAHYEKARHPVNRHGKA